MVYARDLIEKFREALNNNWGYIWGTAGEKWTEAKQKELEKTTDADRAQGRKYGSKWIGHMVADCSGLFSWAFKQLGGYMYHGSDTMYKKYCVNKGELSKGKRTDGRTLLPGTAVFVWNGTKYSHVGLFVGDGVVIEAMGTQNGVTTTKVTAGKWTHWGELKDVSFEGVDASNPASGSEEDKMDDQKYPTLKKGNKGDWVAVLQQKLMLLGYELPHYGVDGDFGAETEKAVKQFQKDRGLNPDGIVGPKTWAALNEERPKSYTIVIKGLPEATAKFITSRYGGEMIEDKE